MTPRKSLAVLLTVSALGGCAATYDPASMSFTYTPPAPRQIDSSVVVQKPFDRAWNDMVKRLATSYYRINQVAKASRIINLDLDTEDASPFVDCGESFRAITFKGKVREFRYNPAGSKRYESTRVDGLRYWFEVQPTSKFNGVMNIYMAPEGGDRTQVSVNVRYKVRKKFSGKVFTQRQDGEYRRASALKWRDTVYDFTTAKPYRKDIGDGITVVCQSTGKLETEILGYASR